jgi:ribosome-associated protein
MHEHDDEFEDDLPPSKSQRKRDVEALQNLGRDLSRLSKDQLKKFDLPEHLLAALLEFQRLKSHGAMRRQMQFIGKIMREIQDEEVDAIVEQLAALRGESTIAKAEFHALERWRERLLADDDALTEWLGRHPDADVQHVRQLIRNARKEAEQGKPPKSSRELFKVLRDASR